jgi:hypothetical protein
VIYHVEVVGIHDSRTDTSTKSFDYARRRRASLTDRGVLAEVRTGAGRLVIDIAGTERR